MISKEFFDRDAFELAYLLLGKLICRESGGETLKVRIIETEAYYKAEKASHASLGYTHKRRALFMEGGTIYMYHARGKPSLNISARGEGNAVLIKSAAAAAGIETMLRNNPRDIKGLCCGQTLLCLSMGLRVEELDAMQMGRDTIWVEDDGYRPTKIVQAERLGIPDGRDGHLPYRLIDYDFAKQCTKNPLSQRAAKYSMHEYDENPQNIKKLFQT